jgi:uncharacterized protein (DUF58 family)
VPRAAVTIPADVRARLRGLNFRSRFAANGAGVGLHAGRSRGAGLEFAQYRAYEPGDEPRRVDWKLYARSDRFFVRDATRDSPLTVWALIDASASMAQADAARPQYSKLEAAKVLAACVAEIALQQGDDCGLMTLSGNDVRILAPGAGTRHRDRLLLDLRDIECTGSWPDASGLAPAAERLAAGSLVVIVSDGFDAALPAFAGRLAAARRQVLSLGLVSCEERDFPFTGGCVFRDPETGQERSVDAAAARDGFLARFRRARAALIENLENGGVRHVDHVLDEPPDAPLRRLLHG